MTDIENSLVSEGSMSGLAQTPDMVPKDFFSREHLKSLINIFVKSGKDVIVVLQTTL